MSDKQTEKTIQLDTPIMRGKTEITEIVLRKPQSGAPVSYTHLTSGPHWVGAASYLGEEITIYPYINETIISGGTAHEGLSLIHI